MLARPMIRCQIVRWCALVLLLATGAACSTAESSVATPAEPVDGSAPTTTAAAPNAACDSEPTLCRAETEQSSIEIKGKVSEPVSVAPVAGSPLATIDRDAGLSVRLTDDSVLWLFGDTAARDETGAVKYFVIGTASWAPALEPTVTRDFADPVSGEPVALATPTGDFPECPDPTQRKGMWPASAVVEQVGSLDRVVIWLMNVCLIGDDNSAPVLSGMGMSVAEWWYDPSSPPIDSPIQVTMLNQQLFTDLSYGIASLRGPDDTVFAYRCEDQSETVPAKKGSGPCSVARTTLADVADPDSYKPWNGESYDSSAAPADLELPTRVYAPIPPGSFSVSQDPVSSSYLMAYTPWPAWIDIMEIRVASSPAGPWSKPVSIRLPGCDDSFGSRRFGCYAAIAQPSFGNASELGIGWYDSMVTSFPIRGSLKVATVPLKITGPS